MISLRRATARFLSSRPSASLSINTRSFHSFRIPLARFPNQEKPACVLQRRFASEEAVSKSDTEVEVEPKEEHPVEPEISTTPSSETELEFESTQKDLEYEQASNSTSAPDRPVEPTQENLEHEQTSISSNTPDQPVEPKSFVTSASDAISNAASSAAKTASSAAETVSGAASAIVGTAQNSDSQDYVPSSAQTSIYVGNIFFDVTEEDLVKEFSKVGPVKRTKLITDPRGMSKGFGYVDFETPENVDRAIDMYNQQIFEGRRLTVQKAISPLNFKKVQRVRNPPSKTVFVGNLPYSISDRDLNNLFRDVKDVIDVRVAIDRRTGQPRGFAHAEFTDVESARRAFDLLQGKQLSGRTLRLDYSAASGRAVMREGDEQARPSSEGSDFY